MPRNDPDDAWGDYDDSYDEVYADDYDDSYGRPPRRRPRRQQRSRSRRRYEDSDDWDDPEEERLEKKGSTALTIGIVAMIAWLLPIVGLPVAVTGLVFGSQGARAQENGKAIAGIVLSAVGLMLTIGNSILGIMLMQGQLNG